MKHILVTAFLCLMLMTSACSNFDESVAAYDRGNYATALFEWQRLARLGYLPAQYNLGLMYYNGDGVPQDYVQTYQWINLAASQGYKYALDNRHIVANELTPDQFAEAQRRVREWWMLTR